MDQKFQATEKTKYAFAVTEQKVSNAGSNIMKNRYVITGASWVTGAFNKVSKAASDVGNKTKEKVVAEHGGLTGAWRVTTLRFISRSLQKLQVASIPRSMHLHKD